MATSLRKTAESIAIPCSVKTYGNFLRPPYPLSSSNLEVAICDFKFSYHLKGWQMIKSENAQLLVDGKPVENDYTFTATDSKMEIQIEFTFNASELAGKELVTFEELYDMTNPDEPIKVAEHKDINDEGQTVTVKYSCHCSVKGI